MLRIKGNTWIKLQNQILRQSVIDIVGCGDIHRFEFPPQFPRAETIFMRDCDKNFVYYWLEPYHFPKTTKIYLDSHPCEYNVAHRFGDKAMLYMRKEYYDHYYGRWWDKSVPYIRPITGCNLGKALEGRERTESVPFLL